MRERGQIRVEGSSNDDLIPIQDLFKFQNARFKVLYLNFVEFFVRAEMGINEDILVDNHEGSPIIPIKFGEQFRVDLELV